MHRREFLRALVVASSGLVLTSPFLRSDRPRVGSSVENAPLTSNTLFHQANLSAAPRVVLDPGHGGWDSGGVGEDNEGNMIDEKNVTLSIARRTAYLLQRDGCAVRLTRTSDVALADSSMYDDLQARIDLANAWGADAFLSIHINTFPNDPSVRGITTYYCADRPFGNANGALATAVQEKVIGAMNEIGLEPPDNGVVDDAYLSGPGHLVVLGPPDGNHPRATQMPGALTELMYLSNPAELAALERDDVLSMFAHGIARGVEAYLGV
jgi:N-acetylmuramoyl-L-alanine amidase